MPGHSLAADIEELNFKDKPHYRNFYLVTQSRDFQRLKNVKFNSVLQAHHVQDDGSLSVYLANRDYINVEAGFNQLAAQIMMLKYA